MENFEKFSAANSSSDASACKLDTMTCVGGGAGGNSAASSATALVSGGAAVGADGGNGIGDMVSNATSSTPSVSSHTSTWLAALHVNNNNNNTDKLFNPKDLNHHICSNSSSGAIAGDNLSSKGIVSNITAAWQCESCDMYQKNGTACGSRVAFRENEADFGGNGCGGGAVVNVFPSPLNGSAAKHATALNFPSLGIGENNESPEALACALPVGASFLYPETDFDSYDMRGAVSLSPPLMEDPFDEDSEAAAAAFGGGHSNRTSLNNSTENLSYNSDNFYGDDLILLGDDADLEPEELSLNSDDCVYAYRGAGAEFDLPLPPTSGLPGNFGLHQGFIAQEEETDFLEMDFEPDPPSELDYNHSASSLATESKDQYFMQRDSCRLVTPTQRHQLFSSPIDDLPPAPKALQAQSMLSKNFARITLHLDQIQKDYSEERDDDREDDANRERLNSALDSRPAEEEFSNDTRSVDTSHSLPSTLHEHFTNRCNSESAVITNSKDGSVAPLQTLGLHTKSPSKITGAKPKRLSTFSSTSSTSSKNSSKSRNSLRSNFQSTTMGASCSFDERSVSCSEFRTERDLSANPNASKQSGSLLSSAVHAANNTSAAVGFNVDYGILNDETCLDCLEKEFLANTIGKALDPFGCMKCRKRLGYLAMYNRSHTTTAASAVEHPGSQHHHHHHQQQQQQHTQPQHTSKYRRSASPTTTYFYNEQTSPASRLFSCEFLNSQARKRQEWDSLVQEHRETFTTANNDLIPTTIAAVGSAAVLHDLKADVTQSCRSLGEGNERDLNQSLMNLDSKLLNNLKPPDPCAVTIPTVNIMETSLVQALDKLQIAPYNKELISGYFKKFSNNTINYNACLSSSSAAAASSSTSTTNMHEIPQQEFTNLKEFLLFVSKRHGNYHELKRLIGKLTQKQQVLVQFKKDSSITELEMVPVKVSDILHYWSKCKDLECLKEMDRRFHEANILGKIANIIRQAHQRSSSSSRRPLAELIAIPQYYPSGFLTLTKKC